MKRRARKGTPEQIRERSLRRLRFQVIEAKATGATTREIHEVTTRAIEDWRFLNG